MGGRGMVGDGRRGAAQRRFDVRISCSVGNFGVVAAASEVAGANCDGEARRRGREWMQRGSFVRRNVEACRKRLQ